MAFGFNGFASIASKLLRHDFQVVSSKQLSFPSARYPTCLGRTRRRTKQLDWRGLDLLSDCAVEMTTYSPRRSYNAGRDRNAKALPPKRLRRACHESHLQQRSIFVIRHFDVRESPHQAVSARRTGAAPCTVANCSGHIDRGSEPHSHKTCRCRQIDGDLGTFSCPTREGRNAVHSATLVADTATSLLSQDQPS